MRQHRRAVCWAWALGLTGCFNDIESPPCTADPQCGPGHSCQRGLCVPGPRSTFDADRPPRGDGARPMGDARPSDAAPPNDGAASGDAAPPDAAPPGDVGPDATSPVDLGPDAISPSDLGPAADAMPGDGGPAPDARIASDTGRPDAAPPGEPPPACEGIRYKNDGFMCRDVNTVVLWDFNQGLDGYDADGDSVAPAPESPTNIGLERAAGPDQSQAIELGAHPDEVLGAATGDLGDSFTVELFLKPVRPNGVPAHFTEATLLASVEPDVDRPVGDRLWTAGWRLYLHPGVELGGPMGEHPLIRLALEYESGGPRCVPRSSCDVIAEDIMPVVPERWNYLAMVVDRGSVWFAVNGENTEPVALEQPSWPGPESSTYIGRTVLGDDHHLLAGEVDEVRISSDALEEGELFPNRVAPMPP